MTLKRNKALSVLQINAIFSLVACILMSATISVLLYRSLSNSITEMTQNTAKEQVQQMGLSFKNFLKSHQTILKDYSEFPSIKQAAVQPETHIEDAADLMKSFSFIGQRYPLMLIDFEAEPLHHSQLTQKILADVPQDLTLFIDENKSFHMSLMTSNDEKHLILGSEILVKNTIEGALLTFISVDSILARNLTDTLQYEIYFQNKSISPKINTSGKKFLSSTIELNNDFTLKTYVRTDLIMAKQTSLVYNLILAIVMIFILFSFVSFYLVNKNFLRPIVSLKEMTQSISKGNSTLPIPVKTSIKELNLLQEDFKKMVSTLNDRTEALNEANTDLEQKVIDRTKELQDKAEELEQLSKYKSEFLARMSHEIRTPMNAIVGYIEILKESNMSQEDQNHLDIINNSADALLTIINDILDFSKIEAGMLRIEQIPFNLNKILQDTQNMFTKTADDKGLELIIGQIKRDHKWLLGDPNRLRQILINLTGNALKFTKAGTVKISIESQSLDDTNVEFTLNISDTGIGIPEDKLSEIFQSFSQAEGSITRKFGGTGLGLPISRNLAELMGGQLTANSTMGKGSNFVLKASLKKANPLEQTTILQQDILWQDPPDILLVEDNLVNQKLAMKTLDKLGCKITTAINGNEAIKHITEHDFDLVLMDCQMPILDGLETTRKLRKDPDYQDLTIIAFTANAMEEEIKQCFDAGMNDYLTKPFKRNQFAQKLAKWLKHKIKVA
ncbi:MAG: ATP-binding protein [Lentisphaerales bacterium]|nr:ATP-binding protein [Lentisphaerales bacterium]